jgi:hypothetical protein
MPCAAGTKKPYRSKKKSLMTTILLQALNPALWQGNAPGNQVVVRRE